MSTRRLLTDLTHDKHVHPYRSYRCKACEQAGLVKGLSSGRMRVDSSDSVVDNGTSMARVKVEVSSNT